MHRTMYHEIYIFCVAVERFFVEFWEIVVA